MSTWGNVGSVTAGVATSYIDGANDLQQNFQVGVQGPAGEPHTHALREPLSPLTVPITLSMCFFTEGHGESLAEAIIKGILWALTQCGLSYTPGSLDIPHLMTPYYGHSLSVGLATHLTPLVSGSPVCLSSSQTKH